MRLSRILQKYSLLFCRLKHEHVNLHQYSILELGPHEHEISDAGRYKMPEGPFYSPSTERTLSMANVDDAPRYTPSGDMNKDDAEKFSDTNDIVNYDGRFIFYFSYQLKLI